MGFAWMAESADLGVVTGMDEYIERQALLDKLKERDLCLCVTEQDIKDAPAADVAPVRHGRWDNIPNTYMCVAGKDGSYHGYATSCSACHEINPNAYKTNYCPNCGAKMDLEEV